MWRVFRIHTRVDEFTRDMFIPQGADSHLAGRIVVTLPCPHVAGSEGELFGTAGYPFALRLDVKHSR
jgi:hypothetical protein